MLATKTYSIAATVALAGALGFNAANLIAQAKLDPVQLASGPWEVASVGRIDGVFIAVHGDMLDVRVYHRPSGAAETWGWYRAPAPESVALPRAHLAVAGLDVKFDPVKMQWSGTWAVSASGSIVLLRPQSAPNASVTPFRGDWESVDDPANRFVHRAGRLHIVQSLDGKLTAWMDSWFARENFGNDTRFGELLDVVSATSDRLVLVQTNVTGVPYRYEATLSSDGTRLSGAWTSPMSGPGGPFSSAPAMFVKTP